MHRIGSLDRLTEVPLDSSGHFPLNKATEKKASSFCGREFTLCQKDYKSTICTVAAVAGAVLLILGILALAGYFAPNASAGAGNLSTVLHKLNAAATAVAAKLGTDLFTLAMFTASAGAALLAAGVGGYYAGRCVTGKRPPEVQNLPPLEGEKEFQPQEEEEGADNLDPTH